MIKNVLTIAGSDPSGGAGIQADLKTFVALGVYGMTVITALTAQNTCGVQGVHAIPAAFITQQLRSIFDDITVDAVKIGMVGDAQTVTKIADMLKHYNAQNIILDPVMVATSGDRLVSDEAVVAVKEHLIPMASLVTPNISESEILGQIDAPCLVKGGHDNGKHAIDTLTIEGKETTFSAPRIDSKNTHGTGCTLSSAIAAYMAKGLELEPAINAAKSYLTQAIAHGDKLNVGNGQGHGPVHHGWTIKS